MWQQFKRTLLKSIMKCLVVKLLCQKVKNSLYDYEKKVRAQVKSRFYYVFWVLLLLGVAVALQVFGQLYVGYGYRLLHGDMRELLDKVDGVLLHKDGTPYGDML